MKIFRTTIKDAALNGINGWAREFYIISRIALAESPQLLESLGKVVRS